MTSHRPPCRQGWVLSLSKRFFWMNQRRFVPYGTGLSHPALQVCVDWYTSMFVHSICHTNMSPGVAAGKGLTLRESLVKSCRIAG
jgi:hypothetical protein